MERLPSKARSWDCEKRLQCYLHRIPGPRGILCLSSHGTGESNMGLFPGKQSKDPRKKRELKQKKKTESNVLVSRGFEFAWLRMGHKLEHNNNPKLQKARRKQKQPFVPPFHTSNSTINFLHWRCCWVRVGNTQKKESD